MQQEAGVAHAAGSAHVCLWLTSENCPLGQKADRHTAWSRNRFSAFCTLYFSARRYLASRASQPPLSCSPGSPALHSRYDLDKVSKNRAPMTQAHLPRNVGANRFDDQNRIPTFSAPSRRQSAHRTPLSAQYMQLRGLAAPSTASGNRHQWQLYEGLWTPHSALKGKKVLLPPNQRRAIA